MTRNVQDMEQPAVELRCATCQTRSRVRPASGSPNDPAAEISRELFEELRVAVNGYCLGWYCRHCRKTTEHELVRLPRSTAAKQPASRRAR